MKLFNYPNLVARIKELSKDDLSWLTIDHAYGFSWVHTFEGYIFWRKIFIEDNPEAAFNHLDDIGCDITASIYRSQGSAEDKLKYLGYSDLEIKEICIGIVKF